MNRRYFFQIATTGGLSYLVLRITGCGPSEGARALDAAAADGDLRADTVMMQDITMEGWSTLGSGFLGNTGILKATVVRDRKEVNMNYIQDPHGHKFTIKPEHLEKLIRGEKVEILTTEAQGHHHRVVINPKNVVSGSQAIPIPLNPNATAESMFAALSEKDAPDLYVTATAELQEDSVQYCLDTAERCDADASLWANMARHAPRADKQIFASSRQLALDTAKAEYPLIVRAKAKSDARALRFIMKVLRR